MKIHLKIWRQKNSETPGKMVDYTLDEISPEISFLEMLDILNEDLLKKGEEPVAFDHDCREGICGMCSLYINGRSHGTEQGITACQLHLRSFKEDDTIYVEPWRAQPFPVIKDLIVDRSAFDRIIQAGGYISVNTGSAPDANAIPISREVAKEAFEAADCIGCGACVAACKNASAMLFVAAKVSHLALLPQGQVEKQSRVEKMVAQMDKEGFGACTNTGACSYECPKNISLSHIARLNREYLTAKLASKHLS
ncbi:succinate dehydrogenase/fumarate reductase iron-sulfur subunit [Candidatus Parabeggiatoa sp. HSG14]|uniref:succinate dehydrogenase/fumarate reductase iron-sulfur subunit n=1 Tax=Candidatus Parabeggiatoa sp. HSG14 TaxID=3055593 RepID=UPI0025A84795|nr:succinate dehydrogenase/fumarate reductase iron-sulfur subunit [Thiotrichales bacterium HSG14]